MNPLLRSGKISEICCEVPDDLRGLALIIGFGEERAIGGDSVVVWWDNRGIGDVPRLPRTIVAQIDFFLFHLRGGVIRRVIRLPAWAARIRSGPSAGARAVFVIVGKFLPGGKVLQGHTA